ncbi:hypothetical protein HU147_01100 [Planomicrobium chinense]|uniref:hypothetical protein n=1 Tax=Planococcus chinensis TaxID=272917 RepID=UPI001CC6C885|nr:hypothetical protein [Planococcus chinensis]MBZ5199798.1 hypothetical protein [Planococcus chinensis]
MKKWRIWLLVGSLLLNVYLIGKGVWVGQSTPNEEDRIMLGEMTALVAASADYQKLAETEQVFAVKPGVDRNKGGAYPYHYGVVVETEQQSYIFSCTDSACGKMEIAGTMYSRYSEEKPMLPLEQ